MVYCGVSSPDRGAKMSQRSVIETLDLHNDYNEYRSDGCATQSFGFLSPRISFSTDFNGSSSERLSPGKKKTDSLHSSPNSSHHSSHHSSPMTEFEFSMSSLNVAGSDTPGFIVPADELFHKGKLLPGFLPPNSAGIDDTEETDATSTLPDGPLGYSSTTISRHLTAESTGGPTTLGCVLGPSCLRTPKGPKWRELFGALRRVKSDSGRQRIPDESLLPPKTFHGKKKFFKQIFGTGNVPLDPKSSSTLHVASTRTSYSSSATPSTTSSVSHAKNMSWDSASHRFSSRGASASASPAVDCRSKAAPVYPQSTSSEVRGGEPMPDFRGKSCAQSSDGFTFNPTPGRARPSSSGRSSASTSRVVSPIKAPIRGANFGRSTSGRVIVRGLDRVSSGRNSASLQDQVRALRSREIRRSPDRSGYSNVRVAPVLNVPVCMGPVLRGASKASKGRLSNFRSFLTFKSKLATSMSTSPIATR